MRAIITGGGTGGHVFPALAIADKIMEKDPDSKILYLGHPSSMEEEIVLEHGYNFKAVPSRWLEKNPIAMIKLGSAVIKGIKVSREIMKEFKPDCVIGTGGFVCFPVIVAANREKIPCYVHEQNAFPGMANRTLERFVDNVFLAYPEATSYFKQPQKHVYTGNPVRKAFFESNREESRKKLGIPSGSFHILAMGGSWGAKRINLLAEDILSWIQDKPEYTCTFITGHLNYEETKQRVIQKCINTNGRSNILGFVNDMPNQIAAADLIISRSGALTMTEINVAGRAAILVPFPNATDNHQYYNAKAVADHGGAILIEEKDLVTENIIEMIEKFKENRTYLDEIEEASLKCSPGQATETIWEHITRKR
ncbi:undecaprenyldiphospho-muramoylpentapeptide beta-N-acetylglucosaminyltransferase [Eubacteriales bacterium KG127]